MNLAGHFKTFGKFISQPEHLMRTLGWSAVILFALQWLFHLDQIVVAVQQLGYLELPRYMLEGFGNFLRYVLDDFIPTGLLLIALFQGATIAMLTEAAGAHSGERRLSKRVLTLTFIGSGCAACSGSILAPILSLLTSSVAVQLNNAISRLLIAVGLILAAISFWQAINLVGHNKQFHTKSGS